MPVITASAPTGYNQNITVTIIYPANATIKQYGYNGVDWQTYTAPLTVSTNTTVYAKYSITSGQESEIAKLLVTNVDTFAPTVAFSPNGSVDKITIASTKVSVYDSGISGLNNGSLKYYWDTQNTTIPSSGWTSFTDGATISKTNVTGTYYLWVQASDTAGNTITAKSNLFNIDTSVPVSPTFAVDTTSWTKNDVNVTITYPEYTASKLYSLNGSTWNLYTSTVSIKYNTKVYAKCTSLSGKESLVSSLTVSNIDKDTPSILFNASGGDGSATVNVTVTASDTLSGVNGSTLQYAWDTQNVTAPTSGWTSFTNGATITKTEVSGTYYLWVKAQDNVANATVTKSGAYYLAVPKPTAPTITPSTTNYTNQDVTVTISYATGSYNPKYSLDGVNYTTYINPITISSNTKVYAMCSNVAGMFSDIATLNITNIDKTPPSVLYHSNGSSNSSVGSTKVTVSDTGGSGLNEGTLQYVWDTQNTTRPTNGWTSFTNGDVITKTSVNGSYYLWIKGTDNAGNAIPSNVVSAEFNIDNTPPSAPQFNLDPSGWTFTDVTVSISYSGDSVESSREYSLDGTNWIKYNGQFTLSQNATIYAKCQDLAQNNVVASLSVLNIDKTAPSLEFGTNGASNVFGASTTVTVSDTISGVDTSTLQYVWDTQNTTQPTSGWAAFTNGGTITKSGVTGTYYLWVKGSDNAGNQLATLSVSNAFIIVDVNPPVLATGMTAVKWNSGTSMWDNVSDPTTDTSWYKYNTTDKLWANAKTADGSFWVWVPRYVYKISSGWHSNTEGTINIQFSSGTDDNWNSSVIGAINTNTTANASNNTWTNHPAFTFGSTELTGIWVAKFFASGSATAVASKPGSVTLRYDTGDEQFTASRNMEYTNGGQYGWGTTGAGIDTHMMKNVELGAVAYLSHSAYGRNGTEITINDTGDYYTGGGSGNAYVSNTNQSTTGNIYGIYDMRSDTYLNTSAYVDNANSSLRNYNLSMINAGARYKDVYPMGTTDTAANNYAASIVFKGDAVYETSNNSDSDTGSWFGTTSTIPYSGYPMFTRSSYNYSYFNDYSEYAGIFNFNRWDGTSVSDIGFRPVLMVSGSFTDDSSPTVAFSANGGSFPTTASTTVTVSDTGGAGVNTSTLKYAWTTNTNRPLSGWTSFTNGATLTKTGAGSYYLWIMGEDTQGNSVVTRSNVFTVT